MYICTHIHTPKKYVLISNHPKIFEMVQALFRDQSSLNFETKKIHFVFFYMSLLFPSCLENIKVYETKIYPTCFAVQAKLLATPLAKPLFKMIYLDEVKQWKVRNFVTISLMYS